MKSLITLILILLITAAVQVTAQVTVTGTIVDKQSLEPVAGVTIKVEGTSVITMTDDFGRFKFESSSGAFKLMLDRIGYFSKEVSADASKPLYIQLAPSPVELTGVQVNGSNQVLRPQSVGVLTREDLDRSSGLSVENSINMCPVFLCSRVPHGEAPVLRSGATIPVRAAIVLTAMDLDTRFS